MPRAVFSQLGVTARVSESERAPTSRTGSASGPVGTPCPPDCRARALVLRPPRRTWNACGRRRGFESGADTERAPGGTALETSRDPAVEEWPTNQTKLLTSNPSDAVRQDWFASSIKYQGRRST